MLSCCYCGCCRWRTLKAQDLTNNSSKKQITGICMHMMMYHMVLCMKTSVYNDAAPGPDWIFFVVVVVVECQIHLLVCGNPLYHDIMMS